MDITVYLPDEIGKRAKAAKLPLSQLLRAAVLEELHRRKMMEATIEQAEVHRLDLVDEEGRQYVGRLTGTHIGAGGEWDVYLADDERVFLYNRDDWAFREVTNDPEGELWVLGEEGYIETMHALGLTPEVDI